MMLAALPLLPLLVGFALLGAGPSLSHLDEGRLRRLTGGIALLALACAAGVALWGAATLPSVAWHWGSGITLALATEPSVRVPMLLVPAVTVPVLLWALGHEEREGLCRLTGGLLAFAGAMELLVLAADLLVLLIAWELVGGLSFVLIAHRYRDDEAVASATYAFNATRLGGLGLFVAAGAALAGTGTFAFDQLHELESPHRHLLAAGVLLAAVSKAAQWPFAPWLFRAMAGPTSVSALLHSSTMVAAGAWLLIRLQAPLHQVAWLAPVTIGLGLTTALLGGLVAAAQGHAKRLLAASTSAQYGLMFAAAGAGAAGAALAHLVAHAVLKALLFLVAGSAISSAGTADLARMRVGRRLPVAAVAGAIGALSLAAVPPLGAAWSKELIVAATGHVGVPFAVMSIVAGGLGAFYAARFYLLAFGRAEPHRGDDLAVLSGERIAYGILGLGCLALSALWLPGLQGLLARWADVEWPEGAAWELPVSVVTVLLGFGTAAWLLRRKGPTLAVRTQGARDCIADWLGLPVAIDVLLVRPASSGASVLARCDDRIVELVLRGSAHLGRGIAALARRFVEFGFDASVEASVQLAARIARVSRRADEAGIHRGVLGVGRGIGVGGRVARRLQRGAVPFYYALVCLGLFGTAVLLWLGGDLG